MIRSATPLGLVLALSVLGCAGAKRSSPLRPLSPKEASRQLVESTELARGMLRYDMVAWWGTDALAASGLSLASLEGWLVLPAEGNAAELRILGSLPAGPRGVVAIVRCDAGEGPSSCVVDRDFEARAMSDEEKRMRRAIETASGDPFFVRAQESYNPIILRGADYGQRGWIVYLTASTTNPNVIPIGRHFRFDVSEDGRKVLRRRASHRTILEFARAPEEDAQVVGIAHSAPLDRQPSEFTMYASGLWGVPIEFSACDRSLWHVAGLQVAQLAEGSRRGACFDPWKER